MRLANCVKFPLLHKIPSEQIPVIQCLRGIAALSVCLFHLVTVPADFITMPIVRNSFELGRYGVHMFFMISAIVIPLSMVRNQYSYRNWDRFMLKRLVRLEPAYLVAIVLTIIKYKMRVWLDPGTEDLTPGTRDLFLHLGYLVPFVNGQWASEVFWTLSIEFQFYLFLSLLFPFVLNGNKYARFSFYSIFLLLPFLEQNHELLPLYGPLFLAGIVSVLRGSDIINLREYGIVSVLCLVVSIGKLPAEAIIASMSTLIVVNTLSSYSNRLLNFLGRISYSLYLIHIPTGLAFINIMSHHYTSWYQKLIIISSGCLIAIGSAWVFFFMNISARIQYRKTVQTTPVMPQTPL